MPYREGLRRAILVITEFRTWRSSLNANDISRSDHRGSSRQSAYFMRTLKIQQEAAVLASFCALAGLVPSEPSAAAGAATSIGSMVR